MYYYYCISSLLKDSRLIFRWGAKKRRKKKKKRWRFNFFSRARVRQTHLFPFNHFYSKSLKKFQLCRYRCKTFFYFKFYFVFGLKSRSETLKMDLENYLFLWCGSLVFKRLILFKMDKLTRKNKVSMTFMEILYHEANFYKCKLQ